MRLVPKFAVDRFEPPLFAVLLPFSSLDTSTVRRDVGGRRAIVNIHSYWTVIAISLGYFAL